MSPDASDPQRAPANRAGGVGEAAPVRGDGISAAASTLEDSNLTSRTLHGVRWTYFSTVFGAILQLGFAAWISRLLPPSVFGVLAVAQMAVALGGYFARLGLGPALVQRAAIGDLEIRACFTTGTLMGVASAAVMATIAPFVSVAVREPEVTPVLQVMALTLLLAGISLTSQALLTRQLRFKSLALISVGTYGVGYFAVGIPLALAGAGVWSLVAAIVTQRLLASAVSYALVRHRLRPAFAFRSLGPLYSYGGKQTGSGIVEYLAENLDTFAVTRYLGAEAGGQYNRAYVLVSLPLYYLTASLTDVLFPSFSKLQKQTERLRQAFSSALGFAAAILFPVCAGLAVAREELVLVVLGPQWVTTADILPWIALANAFHFLSGLASTVCEAVDAMTRKLVLEVLTLLLLVGLIALAVGTGDPRAFAAALAGAELFRQAGYVLVLRLTVGVHVASILIGYLLAAAAAATTAAAIFGARLGLIEAGLPVGIVLSGEIVAGAVTLLFNLRAGFLRRVRADVLRRLVLAGALGSDNNPGMAKIVYLVLGRP